MVTINWCNWWSEKIAENLEEKAFEYTVQNI